ncbi:putative DNA-binding protein (MmcQ/YjbR family) [Providencia alcalifaciens]|uniref:Putative DNA-binding protein (MmcQ/YjbR family) n=3 Tax=Morganellaceae TaxID=1903414 RepID=A0A4R3NT46_9GAMM|nr:MULTISPECIES: MmcQ/YjbR family DNA-binding protein [Providencia]MBC5790186.1 MmcQ/YjbR family DNA-binding protein [Providencia sp. JUb39]TCT38713.1 putative DNA-binding protein (MmcQ/YjbR family) [Providencia alcalifaciens]
MNKNELMEYIQSNYGAVAEYPWAKFPSYIIYRHKNNAKWFAVILTISSKRLYESESDEMVNIINLKSPPELVGSLRLKEGVYPAYHMNKEHWITIKLDSGFPEDELKALIDESYKLTAKSLR